MIDEKVQRNARLMYLAAMDKIKTAHILMQEGQYNDALSRAYYGAFHAVSLLFLLNGETFSRHSQLIGNFNKQFISTGKLPKKLGKTLINLFDERQGADYDFYHRSTLEEANNGIREAEELISEIKKFVKTNFDIELVSNTELLEE